MVISNISINFVHNYYKPTEDAVYDKYKYHARVWGIFESYLPHAENINSLCRTTSHYVVWEGDPLTAQLTDLDMKDVTDRLAKVRKKYNQILFELLAQSSAKIAGF